MLLSFFSDFHTANMKVCKNKRVSEAVVYDFNVVDFFKLRVA